MQIDYLSTTLVSGHELCPTRALDSYGKRLEHGDDQEGTDATRFGTVVHAVLEDVFQKRIRRDAEIDELIAASPKLYLDYWAKSSNSGLEYFELGLDRIEAFVKSAFDSPGEPMETELLFVYDAVADKTYLNPRDPIALCKRIRAMGGVPIMSKIDRLDYISADDMYHVNDYKTNRMQYTRDEMEESTQLGIYALTVRAHYRKQVLCTYDMFRHGVKQSVLFTDEKLESMRQYLIAQFEQINSRTGPPERKVNKYCRYCPLRGGCEPYQKVLKGELPPILTDETDTPDELYKLAREAEQLKDAAKAIEGRQDELKAMFAAKFTEEGLEELVLGDRKVKLPSQLRQTYNMHGVFGVLADAKALLLIRDFASINKGSLERAMKSRPDLKRQLDAHLEQNFTKPSLNITKVK